MAEIEECQHRWAHFLPIRTAESNDLVRRLKYCFICNATQLIFDNDK